MHYKSFSDLSQDIKSNLTKIPLDVSLVVGIPRSGLLAASLISIYLNLPLTDIDSFLNGGILSPCRHGGRAQKNAFAGKILVVDDSVATGKAIIDAKQKLAAIVKEKNYELLYCCVYAEPGRKEMVDVPLVLLDRPRLFEWNIFHNSILGKACVEIDGVLCKRFEEESPGNEAAYEKYMADVPPNFIPKAKIACIVTSRPQKYRLLTEAWLQENKIRYDKLIMFDPQAGLPVERFKAVIYKKNSRSEIFYEGSANAAQSLFEQTGKDVYCFETNRMLTKMNYQKLSLKVKRKSIYFIRNLRKGVLKF